MVASGEALGPGCDARRVCVMALAHAQSLLCVVNHSRLALARSRLARLGGIAFSHLSQERPWTVLQIIARTLGRRQRQRPRQVATSPDPPVHECLPHVCSFCMPRQRHPDEDSAQAHEWVDKEGSSFKDR